MIKVKFKTPQILFDNSMPVSEVLCFATIYIQEYDDRQIWITQDKNCLVHETSIQSIEIVKPNDI